jgi:hypothetical protein
MATELRHMSYLTIELTCPVLGMCQAMVYRRTFPNTFSVSFVMFFQDENAIALIKTSSLLGLAFLITSLHVCFAYS